MTSCAVLMATFNGGAFLDKQLESLHLQTNIAVSLTISDDHSTDNTIEIINSWSQNLPIAVIHREREPHSNANKNFLSLIANARLGSAEYVALSDQDDIWNHDKLSRAIEQLNTRKADAYSGDVIAFWPNGRKRLIKKSYPQRQHDHLFGSPGPGCTFVFRRSAFMAIREWVKQNHEALSTLWIHDWSIYCYAREVGFKWIIDNTPKMFYRQHTSNAMGANVGHAAWAERISNVLNGQYRHNIVALSDLTGAAPACAQALRRLLWKDRLWLISKAKEFRRSRMEVLFLQCIFLIMPRSPISSGLVSKSPTKLERESR